MTRHEAVVEAAQRTAREGVDYVIGYQWSRGCAVPASEAYYVEKATS